MAKAFLRLDIARSPEDVWSFMMDTANYGAWHLGNSSFISSAGMKEGSIHKLTTVSSRGQLNLISEVLVSDNSNYLYKVQSYQGPIKYLLAYRLHPLGMHTRVTVSIDITIPGMPRDTEALVQAQSEERVGSDLANIKLILEQKH